MKHFFHFLFLPHETNNFRAKTLHPSFFLGYFLIILLSFLIPFSLLFTKPGILGISAEFNPSQIIAKTNEARIKVGLSQLNSDPLLTQAAQKKAEDMVTNGYWAHFAPNGKTPWDFMREAGYNFTAAGENLARDFSNVDQMISAWIASPSHAENLLSTDFTQIGIGVAEGVISGKTSTVVVQMFGKPAFTPVAVVQPENVQPEKPQPESSRVTTVLEAEPIVAQTPKTSAGSRKEIIDVAKLAAGSETVNFLLPTKTVSLAVVALIAFMILADLTFAKFTKVARSGGHPLFHLTILLIIFIAIWYSNSGLIL